MPNTGIRANMVQMMMQLEGMGSKPIGATSWPIETIVKSRWIYVWIVCVQSLLNIEYIWYVLLMVDHNDTSTYKYTIRDFNIWRWDILVENTQR